MFNLTVSVCKSLVSSFRRKQVALDWQSRGRRFESALLHAINEALTIICRCFFILWGNKQGNNLDFNYNFRLLISYNALLNLRKYFQFLWPYTNLHKHLFCHPSKA